jgi:hypothetical protein
MASCRQSGELPSWLAVTTDPIALGYAFADADLSFLRIAEVPRIKAPPLLTIKRYRVGVTRSL